MTNNRRTAASARTTIARNLTLSDCETLAALGAFDAYASREPLRLPADTFIRSGGFLNARNNTLGDD